MNTLIISGVVLFLVHIIWAFINTLSINEGLLISKLRVLGLHTLNWLVPIIGPISVTSILTEHVPPRRYKKLVSSGGSGTIAGGYSSSDCSGSSGCGGGE